MSSQANLKKICDNGLDAQSSKLEQNAAELNSTYADIMATNVDLPQGLERLTSLASDAIKELQGSRSQLENDIENLGLQADLVTCVESIEHEWTTRASVGMALIEGVRSSYRAILGEYDRIFTETLSEVESSNAANTSSSLYHLIQRSSPESKSESNELIGKLTNQEKELTQSVADKTLEALTLWHEGMAGRARVIQAAMEKNQELLRTTTCGVGNNEPVATDSEEIERLKAELSKNLEGGQAETEELIVHLNKQAKAELRTTLTSSNEAGRKIIEDLAVAAAEQVHVVETLFEKQINKEIEKLDRCKANLNASCEKSMEALTELEVQAKVQQQLVAKELAEEANTAALLFQQNLSEVFERAILQVDTIMDKSENELRNLAESIVGRFRKSTGEYLSLLESTSSDVLDEVSQVRSDCVTMLNAYMANSDGGDDN